MTSRPSDPRRAPLPKLGTLALALLLIASGCVSRRSRDWYSGPEEHRDATQDAINTGLAELPRELNSPLKWNWTRNRVHLNVVPPTHFTRGIPQIIMPGGEPSGGYATAYEITLPIGFRPATIIHEAGHVVMYQNRIHGDHHQIAPLFFNRHTY